jgi:hypothetical protein
MEQSQSIIELAKALSKMQGELTSVPKSSTNPFFKSKYADLDAVWDTIRKPLSSNGLSVIQTTYDQNDKIYLETMLLHTSGEWVKSYLPINAKESSPQAIGSAITYARRYAMSAMLGVSADEDDDAEGTTNHKPVQKESKPAEKPTIEPVTKEQVKAIEEAVVKHCYNAKAFIESKGWKATSAKELTKAQAEELIKDYKEAVVAK